MSTAVLDTPEQIAKFRIQTIIWALDMELKTGMKLARNVPTVKALREQYGITAKTKRQALDQMKELIA